MFVRWSNLSEKADEQRRLPGYRDGALIRHFDAPEALDMRFYEVRARSVLNRVPARSRMPFRWTINPYRGCSHACVYCFARPTHRYLGFDAGRDFEREIVVKINAPEAEAVAELNRAGIPTGVLIAPLMPGINDAPHQLEPLLQGAIDAGATSIGGVALHLRGDVRDVFMSWLRDQRPELVERYEDLYRRSAYAPTEERRRLAKLVRRQGQSRRFRGPFEMERESESPQHKPIAAQQSLF